MPFDLNQKFKMVDQSGRQSPDKHTWKDHSLELWEPLVIRKEEIEAEVDRLAQKARPNNGIRRTQLVHPRAEEGTLSFAPGIGLSIDVLLPGERTQRVRTNASVVDFCIKGAGSVLLKGQRFDFNQYDVLTTPGMAVHEYVNDTKDVQVRLRYSNAPLLHRLKVLWLDEDPPADNHDFTETAAESKGEKPKSPYGTFQLTEDGAWLVATPRLPMKANGSGDITAALFTAHLMDTGSPADALARTASSVFAVLQETLDSGERELRLIAAQDAIASPACEFEVEQVR